MSDDDRFYNLVENKYIRLFIEASSVISFLLSNLTIFFLISYFFNFTAVWKLPSWAIQWITFAVGLVVCFALAKTNMLIKTRKVKNEKDKDDLKDLSTSTKEIKLGLWNTLIILFRLLYFNILNDLFIVLIIWTSLYGLIYLTGIASIVSGTFGNLVSMLSIIGILSGIFQFYIQNYKEQVTSKTIGSINKYLVRVYKEVSFREFLQWLKKKDKDFYNKINNKLHENPFKPLYQLFRDQRSGRDSTNITINLSAQNDLLIANSLEFTDIGEDALKDKYEKFFKEKNEEIQGRIDNKDIADLQKNLLPNIMFFDEVITQIGTFGYEMEEKVELETYDDFLEDSVKENMSYLIYKMMGVKDDKSDE